MTHKILLYAAMLCFAGCSPKPILYQNEHYRQVGAEAAKAYLADHDVTVDYVDLGDALTAEAVIAGIEGAVAQDYDGIVIVPIFDGTERAINEATAAGVPGMATLRPRKTVMATASTANGNAASTKNRKNAEDMTFAVSQCIGRIRRAGIYRRRRKTK